jgi:peptidoglycan hydrolase-like protein with peptidoglycan-binding domain
LPRTGTAAVGAAVAVIVVAYGLWWIGQGVVLPLLDVKVWPRSLVAPEVTELPAGPSPMGSSEGDEDKRPPGPALGPFDPHPAAVEAGLGLSRAQRRELQVALAALGHDTRGADGILGRNSRAALSQWQQAAGEPPTGYLTATQHGKLLAEAEPKLAALAAARQKAEQGAPVQPAVGLYQYQTGDEFRECLDCPLMVVVPADSFLMGSPLSELGRTSDEGPQHTVTVGQAFAVGKYEVTFAEWDACVAAGGCNRYRPDDRGWGRDRRPAINVSWNDAKAYVAWPNERTGKAYRLLSEAGWEYAARAGTTTPFSRARRSARRRRTTTATTSTRPAARASIGSGQRRSMLSGPTAGGCTTCTATCGSGRRIATT